MNYQEFIEAKKSKFIQTGFEAEGISECLFDFQAHIVKIALKAGRFAIFADCGLGKTFMQLEWAKQVSKFGSVLILAPLAVVDQTKAIALKYGFDLSETTITNYEQLDHYKAEDYIGIILDESSILKNPQGANKEKICKMFSGHRFKLACTATPSPNDDMEICNHADFLGLKTRSEILATYFVHDGGETSKWRLKAHAENIFWDWVKSWSCMITNPADIGFDGSKYVLPKLNYFQHEIKTTSRNSYQMFNETAVSATNFNQELRETMTERLSKTVEIVNASRESFIVWVKQNAEAEYLLKLIPDAREVKGSDSPEDKKKNLLGFANDEYRVLVTKLKIASMGLNYQNCHNQVFASIDFSFEGLYQGIRRSYRFGQKNDVNIHIITTDTMQNVIHSINRKEAQFLNMKTKLTA
jgi:superfamily II DNA or RNA helicase